MTFILWDFVHSARKLLDKDHALKMSTIYEIKKRNNRVCRDYAETNRFTQTGQKFQSSTFHYSLRSPQILVLG